MQADDRAISLEFPFLAGDDVASRLVRAIDWAATPLGPIAQWPAPLRTILGTMLRSRNPMLLYWGPQLTHFFNAAFIPSLDKRQFPGAMGQPGEQAWSDIWPVIGPKLRHIMQGGAATWDEDQLIPGLRDGRTVDVYWNYSFTPVLLEDGQVGGVLVVATETTSRMVASRRQAALHQVNDALARLSPDEPDLFSAALQSLQAASRDVPCAAYLRWPHAADAPQVVDCVGIGEYQWPAGEPVLPTALAGQQALFDTLMQGRHVVLPGRLRLTTPEHPEPVTDLVLLPMRHAGEAGLQCMGFGLNPRVPLDQAYLQFLQQIADNVGAAIDRGESARARARAFEERDNLLRQAPVAIAILSGPEQTFTLVNPLYCRVTDRSPDQLIGKTYREAFPELADTPLPGILQQVYRTGERYASPESLIPLTIDGALSDRYFEFNLEPMRDLQQQVTGLMAVAIDVTHRVLARASLDRSHAERQQLLERAHAAARAKDEFLAMLGHELRNPLAPIVSALHVMERKGAGAERERAVIERQVKHMTRLVDDLLDVSRIARGRIRLEPTLARAAVLLQRAAEMVQPLAEQRGHRLDVSLPSSPVLWWGDSARLVQVITNLLTNAVRYTPPGGHIRLSGRREGQALVIEVADNGTGIAPELLPDVFDVFYQGQKQGIDRSQGGLGLGLALVKNLVVLHGGEVEAHSAGRDQGSRFVVRLPLREQPALAEGAWPQGEQAAAQSRRVLLVDDNRDAVDLLAESLALQGNELRVAYTPEQALSVAERFQPQVAVLDVGLPDMDGHELGRRLRARLGEGCVLIALSGYGQDSDRERAQVSGFAHYLVKPVEPAQLHALIAGIPVNGTAQRG